MIILLSEPVENRYVGIHVEDVIGVRRVLLRDPVMRLRGWWPETGGALPCSHHQHYQTLSPTKSERQSLQFVYDISISWQVLYNIHRLQADTISL